MSPAAPLYEPANTLKPVAPGLWIVDGPIVRMATPVGGMPFPTRMTVARLADGDLWCHSPIAPDDGLFAAIDALGPVRHLVSPNKLHYAHIAAWKRRYQQATAWASPGVRERASSQRIAVDFDTDLAYAAEQAWAGELDQRHFRGSRAIEEVVFLHRASGTLILADLIENFEAARFGTAMRWIARLGGVLDPDGKMSLAMRFTFRERRTARACLQQMLAWQPQRVILAHGRCYLENAGTELARAFRWLA
ncbi:hypothetical protein RHOFW104T7_12445 [Rhodanobacter thiooxydans]|uniref:DUF4336 domain-containing protein n=1 Tax=Rhodanobacter thiooxydans TaxID=416169 RepID=A0A154QHA0_9GAMM|nr:DUF4336 domain-containing protein [Rhodanobacter thiooxydans]EIL97025.1 hypothetical protein UUA_16068 [Rhodanobacter thiooxydans LCS2]KZC23692.1 hypothetical protein RHOFW104T7_12445 [Rhodanobacter thiooxydans]MCW0200949.1 DUF4336 domain-containing protein [Rhodanobacter thiooxydans]